MRRFVLSLSVFALVSGIGIASLLTSSRPARATIHEGPIASWCALLAYSGQQDVLNPPGLSGQGSEQAFARPLVAAGMLTIIPGGPGPGDGVLIPDTSHPAVKAQWDGTILFPVGPSPFGGTLWLGHVEPNPDFVAFQYCKNVSAHGHG